jgi:carboxyl-terminal processing protease
VNKFIKISLIFLVSLVLLTGAFTGGFIAAQLAPAFGFDKLPFQAQGGPLPEPLSTPTGAVSATPDDLQTVFKPFWEAWTLVHKQYVDQPLDDVKLMRGAISGMLASLGDPHTSYLDPETAKQLTEALKGQKDYEGIGAYVDITGDYLKVISPISGSNSEKAGLLPGDLIIAIDGISMTGVNPEEARQKVLGPAGTTVTLTIQRPDVELPLDIKIVRAKISIPSVESKMLDNNVAYIKLNIFGQTTSDELKKALTTLLDQKPKGLILDLRNNGGGYLQSGIEVASQFIGTGVIVSEKYGDGQIQRSEAISGGLALDIPMVVLVNEGTASASEIVAGALQDYGRAKLVGVISYGKGSVQIPNMLSDDQGEVKITIAKWLTPKDRTIDKIGLTPEVIVKMTADDLKNGLDPQLDAAIKTLLDSLK